MWEENKTREPSRIAAPQMKLDKQVSDLPHHTQKRTKTADKIYQTTIVSTLNIRQLNTVIPER